jgi:hypothetical protein
MKDDDNVVLVVMEEMMSEAALFVLFCCWRRLAELVISGLTKDPRVRRTEPVQATVCAPVQNKNYTREKKPKRYVRYTCKVSFPFSFKEKIF